MHLARQHITLCALTLWATFPTLAFSKSIWQCWHSTQQLSSTYWTPVMWQGLEPLPGPSTECASSPWGLLSESHKAAVTELLFYSEHWHLLNAYYPYHSLLSTFSTVVHLTCGSMGDLLSSISILQTIKGRQDVFKWLFSKSLRQVMAKEGWSSGRTVTKWAGIGAERGVRLWDIRILRQREVSSHHILPLIQANQAFFWSIGVPSSELLKKGKDELHVRSYWFVASAERNRSGQGAVVANTNLARTQKVKAGFKVKLNWR